MLKRDIIVLNYIDLNITQTLQKTVKLMKYLIGEITAYNKPVLAYVINFLVYILLILNVNLQE